MLTMRPSQWMYERRRATVAVAAAAVATLVALGAQLAWSSASVADLSVIALLVYMVVYSAVTVGVFARASHEMIGAWAEREERGTFLQRYLLGSAPGPGVSLFFAAVALVVATVWLPGRGGGSLSPGVRVIVAVALIVVGWVAVAASYAVTFYADNLVEDGAALDFPGESTPTWSDYVYFAISVMTTFGTTDVNVRSKEMRKTVTASTLIAFVFSTVTVAAVVSALVD